MVSELFLDANPLQKRPSHCPKMTKPQDQQGFAPDPAVCRFPL